MSPIARRMADAAGFDLRTLAGTGSGPDGRIVKEVRESTAAEVLAAMQALTGRSPPSP